MQGRLDAAAMRILAAGRAGNPSVMVAPLSRELVIYWHGAVPAKVAAAAGRVGVRVTFKPAAYRFSILVAQARSLVGVPGVIQAAPRPDGGAVNVTVAKNVTAVARQAIRAASKVRLTITTGTRPQATFTRQADIPPFWGGSRYTTALGSCTNGFGLAVPGQPNVYELSAGHCGNNGGAANIPGQPVPTGTILNLNVCRDTLWIDYPAGVQGRIFIGPWNGAGNVGVAGAVADFVGDLVNTGGASSGEHFNISVTAVDVFTPVGGIACANVGPLDEGSLPAPGCAVAPGDSGGPVYSYYTSGSVKGRGTITAGSGPLVPCPGTSPNGYSTVLWAPLVRPAGDPQIGSLQFYGVGILLG